MEIEKIIKVKFIKSGDSLLGPSPVYISTTGEEIIEIDVDFNQLLDIISEIELKRDGLGKNLHKEAFTGLDYLGNKVSFSSYAVWQDDGKIYKYNFDEDWIPFNRVKRDETIKKIIR